MRLTASVVAAASGEPDRARTNAATVSRARWSPQAERALATKMATNARTRNSCAYDGMTAFAPVWAPWVSTGPTLQS